MVQTVTGTRNPRSAGLFTTFAGISSHTRRNSIYQYESSQYFGAGSGKRDNCFASRYLGATTLGSVTDRSVSTSAEVSETNRGCSRPSPFILSSTVPRRFWKDLSATEFRRKPVAVTDVGCSRSEPGGDDDTGILPTPFSNDRPPQGYSRSYASPRCLTRTVPSTSPIARQDLSETNPASQ